MFFSTQYGTVSSNPSKVHFDGLVHLLRYIRDNKNLGLKYYSKIEYVPIYELLIQDITKMDNQLVVLSYSSWHDWPDTGRSKGAYTVFYQGGPIDNCTHVSGTVVQYSAESEYNAACNAENSLSIFRMLNNEFLNKDPYVVPKQAPLIIFDIK